ncbi:MAG: ADOP family duplicated permease [Acidobacteriota bacterium]
MAQWLREIQQGIRGLLGTRGFSAAVVVTVALGIGLNLVVFSILDAVLFSALPFAQEERLVVLKSQRQGFPPEAITTQEYLHYRLVLDSFEELGLVWTFRLTLTDGDRPEQVSAATVTEQVFALLGVQAQRGRLFTSSDFLDGERLAVISHDLWQRRYGADESLVGDSVYLNGRPVKLAGILPDGFKLPHEYGLAGGADVFLTDGSDSEIATALSIPEGGGPRGNRYGLGLLAQGQTLAGARSELAALNQRLNAEGVYPEAWNFTTAVKPVADEIFGHVRPHLWALQAAALLVLLATCVNVGSLFLARGHSFLGDLAVRSAMGASRLTLMRGLLIENLLLTSTGGLLGLALAKGGISLLMRGHVPEIPRIESLEIETNGFLFATFAVLVTAFLSGLGPALKLSRFDAGLWLTGRSRTLRGARLGSGLVVLQVTLAVVLVAGSLLMFESVRNLKAVDLGIDPSRVSTFRVFLPYTSYSDPSAVVGFYQDTLQHLETVPGVRSAAMVRQLPLRSRSEKWPVEIDGYVPFGDETIEGDWQIVSAAYFEVLGIEVVKGRSFELSDDSSADPVVIVNETMAELYWPETGALGRKLKIQGEASWSTVVGIVEDVAHNGPAEEVAAQWYAALPQASRFVRTPQEMSLVVATETEDPAWLEILRDEVYAVDPAVPVAAGVNLPAVFRKINAKEEFALFFLALFAALALILAILGVYGLVSFVMQRRMHLFGIELALGALPRQMALKLAWRSTALVALGLAIGLGLTHVLASLLGSLFFEVGPFHWPSYALVSLLFIFTGLIASLLPTRRLRTLSPSILMRSR